MSFNGIFVILFIIIGFKNWYHKTGYYKLINLNSKCSQL
jgi:hypothetical protein